MKKRLWGLLGVLVAVVWMQVGQTQAQGSMTKSSAYMEYSAKAFEEASNQKRVLFFAASWCSTCRAADRDIRAKLGEIPQGLVIFKTDYDKETALKSKYGVVRQHTFVLVDARGNALKKWSGGNLAEIVANTR
jgi:thiol-disulfide isomerase/thioredoxin